MKHYFHKVLNFFNLLDHEGNLSITNLLVIAFAIKVLILPTVDWVSFAALLLPLLNYAHKRYQNSKSIKQADGVQGQISQIQQSITEQSQTLTNLDGNVNNLSKRIDQVNIDLNQQKTESTKMALHVGLR